MNPAEDYILKQAEPFRSILMHLQVIIEHTIPEVELKFKWHIPCYYIGKRPICYLNKSKNYIDVGLWHSAYLDEFNAFLVSEKRKVVKSLRYYSLDDVNDDILIQILKVVYKNKDKSFYKQSKN